MFFRTGEAALPRGFVFPGPAPRDRSMPRREATGAERPRPETDDGATGVESASEVYMRSMVIISTL